MDETSIRLDLFRKLLNNNILIWDKVEHKYDINPQAVLNSFEKSYGFEDLAIKQKKNICKSRLDVDISSEVFRETYLDIPLIASNMSTVTNADFCINLYNYGALGILHRAASDEWLVSETEKIANECKLVACSIGVGNDQLLLAKKLVDAGANILFIDIAHGYSDYCIDFGKLLKHTFPNIKIVIGNTTNTDIMNEVDSFADAVKIGIAQGSVCETKDTAGCTEKQLSTVIKFKDISKKLGLPIISDGGIKKPSDFTKAIGAGANSVMAGRIFAMCPESAAETINLDGTYKKIYAGMASRYVQNKWKNGIKQGTCSEGKKIYIDIGESVNDLLIRYSGALRSGITYAGGNNIETFQNNCEFILIN